MKRKSANIPKKSVESINLFGEVEISSKKQTNKSQVSTRKQTTEKNDMQHLGLIGVENFGDWIKNVRNNQTQ